MSDLLSFLHTLSGPREGSSLGEELAELVTDSGRVHTLLDCLCNTDAAALWSPESHRPPLTHAALHDFVSRFSLPASKPHRRLGPNDRVMVALPTGCENAVALLALATYHTCAPVNASCTASELKEDAHRLRAKAIITTRDAEERLDLRALRTDLDCEVIFMDPRPSGPAGLFNMALLTDQGDEDYELLADGHREPSQLHDLSHYSLILHTSGTSGKKKVVPYTLRTLIVGSCAVIKSWNLGHADVNLNMMPLFHVGGIVRNLLAPMMSGGSAIVAAGFDAVSFWTLATTLGATWYYAAPTMHHAILSSRPEDIVASRDTRIRMVCNAAGGLLPTLAVELQQTFGGAVVLPSYGMTECMPIASPSQSYKLERPGCSGVACGPHLSIRNPFDLEIELPAGGYGAVCVRGLPTFEGYETSPDEPLDTSMFSGEGWFDSGDMGYVDQDGYLYITGRSKEIINKGGEVISPFEVEEAIMTVAKDRVETTLAFSVDHDVLQEAIGVIVVPVHGRPRIGLSDLLVLLHGQLHPSKWPSVVVYMDDLPKNNAGKPLRIKLSGRLGLGIMTDCMPSLQRHFEAEVPAKNTPLTEPIACSRVSIDLSIVQRTILDVVGVDDAAVQACDDGILEAFVSVNTATGLRDSDVKVALLSSIAGYLIPERLFVITTPLIKSNGSPDFDAMALQIAQASSQAMSANALVVRDVIANLLNKDPAFITGDSDFFLLGGNSLLLGRLAYFVRKATGADIKVADLFSHSSVNGIASLLPDANARSPYGSTTSTLAGLDEKKRSSADSSDDSFELPELEFGSQVRGGASRSQNHLLVLLVQILPIFFYPLKAAWTWTMIVFSLSLFVNFVQANFWQRAGSLLLAIIVARLTSRIISPLAAVAFKWVVIGRHRPGRYRMWSTYHLRWWIVNQSLSASGRGVFAMHPFLEQMYYRFLGARIGRDVKIHGLATLGELDLLTIGNGACIDAGASVRGFCVERDGWFTLSDVTIGDRAVINAYTQISPGASIPARTVYGPHASSHDSPVDSHHVSSNRTTLPEPHYAFKIMFAWPLIAIVKVASLIPWLAILYLMISTTSINAQNLNPVEVVIVWFSSPQRIMYHAIARVVRGLTMPLIQVFLGIVLKRIMGLQRQECLAKDAGRWTILRRYINSRLLSKPALKRAFEILGTHYQMTSVVFRAMGAKVGRRVYWPGSGIYCPDPELLEIGDDVVFGSRSLLMTTDAIGSGRIKVDSGAMIADRVVLLPCTSVGRKTVMGSGALGRRGGDYESGSTWMGSENGEAICFSKGPRIVDDNSDTLTPFGRAYYKREASFFVFPYIMLVIINISVTALSTGYWSIPAVAAAQVLHQLMLHVQGLHLFDSTWYRFGILYALIAGTYLITLPLLALGALLWTIGTKWLVIGRRKPGPCEWDKSSYCQRWQLHLVLSALLYRGYGNGGVLGPLCGSAYIVTFYRWMGAKIGKNCAIWAGGVTGLMTEPDLLTLGDNVSLDDCSVVAHINSRGEFALNRLQVDSGCALRTGSRLLSGASMETSAMLLEHTLLTSGEIAESNSVYAGWPAQRLGGKSSSIAHPKRSEKDVRFSCPLCLKVPGVPCVLTTCGHIYCEKCITKTLTRSHKCAVCSTAATSDNLFRIYPYLADNRSSLE